MSWIYLQENRERVREALLSGHVDEVITLRATAFDKLVAAMHTFGYWAQLGSIEVTLDKDDDDVPDELLVRELAVMPLLRIANPDQAPTYLFQDYGVLRFLGFTVAQIRDGFNDKGVRSPMGKARMRPHHRDTLYHALKRVKRESLVRFRGVHQRALVEHDLVQGGTFAVDGTGLRHSDRHVVILQQLSGAAPFIVDWRVQGPGRELAVGREMVAQLKEMIGAEQIRWLLMDGAYVDGAWLAELQQQGIGAAVRVYEEMQLLSQYPEHAFEPYRYVRTIQGHKEWHEVELAFGEGLKMWPSYRHAWAERPEEPCPGLWGVLVRDGEVLVADEAAVRAAAQVQAEQVARRADIILSLRGIPDDVSKLLLSLVPHSTSQSSRGQVVFGAVPIGAIPACLAFPDELSTANRSIPAPAIRLAGDCAYLDHAQRRVGGERFRQKLLLFHHAEAEALL